MLMKYKDFKMLSGDEMKKVKGGFAPEEEGGNCTTHCTKTVGNTVYITTCKTFPLGCYCTQSGGSQCS